MCLCPNSVLLNYLCVWIMFQNASSHSVSDFCVLFMLQCLFLVLWLLRESHTHWVRFQHTGLLWGSYTLSNSEAHALFSTSTSRHLSRKSWNTGDSLFFSLISGFPFVAIKYSACKGHTEKQSDSNTADNLSSFLASCFALEAIRCKDCRYKHTLRNKGLQI